MLVLVIRTTVSLRPLAAPSHWPRPQSTRLQASSESDFSSIARGLLAEMEALGEVRFVVQGAGAILESMGESCLPKATSDGIQEGSTTSGIQTRNEVHSQLSPRQIPPSSATSS